MEAIIALLSDEDCKAILLKLCKRLCIRPNLAATRLLSPDDKQDMREGNLCLESLENHLKAWVSNGMPDYANGKTEPYHEEQIRLKREKPFFKEKKHEGIEYKKPFAPYLD